MITEVKNKMFFINVDSFLGYERYSGFSSSLIHNISSYA